MTKKQYKLTRNNYMRIKREEKKHEKLQITNVRQTLNYSLDASTTGLKV